MFGQLCLGVVGQTNQAIVDDEETLICAIPNEFQCEIEVIFTAPLKGF